MNKLVALLAAVCIGVVAYGDVAFQNGAPQHTWSTKPAASTVPTGYQIFVTDVGSNDGSNAAGVWTPTNIGSFWFSDGTDWFPVGGTVNLCLGIPNSTHTGSTDEAQMANCTIPAGIMGDNASVKVEFLGSKDGTTDTASFRVRFYDDTFSASVTADANCITHCAYSTAISSGNDSARVEGEVWADDSTSAQISGQRGAGGWYSQNSLPIQTGYASDLTGDVYAYIGCDMGGTTDTCTLEAFRVTLYK